MDILTLHKLTQGLMDFRPSAYRSLYQARPSGQQVQAQPRPQGPFPLVPFSKEKALSRRLVQALEVMSLTLPFPPGNEAGPGSYGDLLTSPPPALPFPFVYHMNFTLSSD